MATNSGLRRLVHGTRERILSSDHNREQSFEAAMIADALRYLFEAEATEEQAGGQATLASALASPMKAVIFNGLRVRPEIGTFNLFVDPGVGLFVDPGSPASPDDSPAQLVRSAGHTVAGSLVISTPGGGVRIDVIECSVTQVVIESDNRDIFSTSTGTFTPALVNKVVEAQLTYRVRAGTPGGGFPGTATGWTPLAIARVPSAAASNDDCDFWDVRPLRSDFVAAHLVQAAFPAARRQHVSAIDDGAGVWNVNGVVDLEIGGRKVGGNLNPSASGATSLRLDAAGGNQELGYAVTNDRPWYLYLAFPFTLPRWAKYSPASSGARTPLAPRGIPIFTQKAPIGTSPMAGSAIALPAATGLGSNTTQAIVAASGKFEGAFFAGSVTSGPSTNVPNSLGFAPSSGAGTTTPIFTLTGNTHFPACVTAIYVQIEQLITLGAGTVTIFDRSILLKNSALTEVYAAVRKSDTATSPAAGSWTDRIEFWLELPPTMSTPASFKIEVSYQVSGVLTLQKICVKGWRMP